VVVARDACRREVVEWRRPMETGILSLFDGISISIRWPGMHSSEPVLCCDRVQDSQFGYLDQFIVYR
jgi:hypothetical protein